MDMGTSAEIRWREGMVIVESERGWRVIIRASVRSFAEKAGQGTGCHNLRQKENKNTFSNEHTH